jgi:YD repeat-containing protein
VNWNEVASVALETEIFSSEIAYDALGRIVRMAQPDGSFLQPAYHEAGWLKNVAVQLKGESVYEPMVESISYNAKGQRTQISLWERSAYQL